MPTLVHIADEKHSKKIQQSGLKIGKKYNGIFFMPVIQDFFGSHQWIRELKRRRVRTYIGVYFKLKSDEVVWYGKFNQLHKKGTVGMAIKEFLNTEDRLGFEFFIERKIEAREIQKIRAIPQNVGWRYIPGSHKIPLNCTCPMCIFPGDINARKKINKLEPPPLRIPYEQIIDKLKSEKNEYEIENLFCLIRQKRRKTDPEELRFIIKEGKISSIQYLAIALSTYKHPNAEKLLTELCEHENEEVRAYSAEGLIELNVRKGLSILEKFKNDHVIRRIINENTACNDGEHS